MTKLPAVEDVRARLAAIVDSSNDAIISKTLDGVISTWNLAAQQLFGYSAAEAIGQPITLIIPADLHDEEQGLLRRVRVGDRIEHYETYRVLQEALQNAIKHNGMRRIDVTLSGGVDQIELIVRDFGVGFEVSTSQGRGLGLTSMKERVRAVSGRLSIQSQPRHGTMILANVPLGKDDPSVLSAPGL